ncbi:bombesin receptor-activated protein C6orf89 homolog [Babylonia areolata]|uniref:bombesin receptor-activated protein C6orf89 homolog n=1 Tax=Babylonia areolata TaxID=304850 RepID=UPI003FD0FD13
MDKEVAETLAYFSKHAFELRQLGKQWGLSEEEIEECIDKAMSINPKDLPAPETTSSSSTKLKFAARKSWPKVRVCLWFVGAMIVLVGLGALAMQNDEIDHRVGQILQPVFYPFFRYLRLATISLHERINLYEFFNEECMVFNPLFSKDAVLGEHICENCNTVTKIKQFTAASMEQGPVPGPVLLEPVLFKGKGKNVSLETFQNILSNNPFSQLPMLGVKTNLEWASQVRDLLDSDVAKKLAAQPDFYFIWKSKLVWTSQLMRKVFPKPLLLETMEVAIRKTIFINGPKVDSFQLPASPIGIHSWYIQGTGSRKVVLTPAARCQKECVTISVTLNAGDMVTYNCDVYKATVHPEGDDLSIAFLGHFNPEM